jgi:hypothetical protein
VKHFSFPLSAFYAVNDHPRLTFERCTSNLATQVNKWRDQCHASRTIYEELQAQYEQLQGRSNRERIAVESIQKEINSLQHALADQIERSDNENTTTTEVMVRDLKYQLVEKELRLEKLQLEVKSMQTARDNAYTAKDELVATHQAELAVSLGDTAYVTTFPNSSRICNVWLTIPCDVTENDARCRHEQSQ